MERRAAGTEDLRQRDDAQHLSRQSRTEHAGLRSARGGLQQRGTPRDDDCRGQPRCRCRLPGERSRRPSRAVAGGHEGWPAVPALPGSGARNRLRGLQSESLREKGCPSFFTWKNSGSRLHRELPLSPDRRRARRHHLTLRQAGPSRTRGRGQEPAPGGVRRLPLGCLACLGNPEGYARQGPAARSRRCPSVGGARPAAPDARRQQALRRVCHPAAHPPLRGSPRLAHRLRERGRLAVAQCPAEGRVPAQREQRGGHLRHRAGQRAPRQQPRQQFRGLCPRVDRPHRPFGRLWRDAAQRLALRLGQACRQHAAPLAALFAQTRPELCLPGPPGLRPPRVHLQPCGPRRSTRCRHGSGPGRRAEQSATHVPHHAPQRPSGAHVLVRQQQQPQRRRACPEACRGERRVRPARL